MNALVIYTEIIKTNQYYTIVTYNYCELNYILWFFNLQTLCVVIIEIVNQT